MVAKLIIKLYRTQDHPLYCIIPVICSLIPVPLLRIRTNRSGKPPYMTLSQFLSQFTFISQPLVKNEQRIGRVVWWAHGGPSRLQILTHWLSKAWHYKYITEVGSSFHATGRSRSKSSVEIRSILTWLANAPILFNFTGIFTTNLPVLTPKEESRFPNSL